MTIRWAWLTVLFFSAYAASQNAQCDSIVYDETNLLNGSQIEQIKQAAQQLIDQGADVRVRIVNASTGNLDVNENKYVQNCTSWQAVNVKGRKSTMVEYFLSTNPKKLGMYYGAAWHHALDDHWNRIKQDYMVPRFRAADWTGGFVAAEQQTAARLAASKDESVRPTTTTVVTPPAQPTDFSGLWTVFGWALGIGTGVALLFFIFKLLSKRKEDEDELKEAQATASSTKLRVARLLLNYGNDPDMTKNSAFATLSEAYRALAESTIHDPDQPGLAISQYRAINAEYRGIENQLLALKHKDVLTPTEQPPVPKKKHVEKAHYIQPERVVEKTTVIQQPSSQGNDFLTGVVVGDILSSHNEEHESRHRHDDDDRSSSSDFGGGGSSSSGGGFDFGGGGSSDFGGGGGGFDSGGGGSSDF